MQQEFYVGVDVGNFDTKSPNFTFPSGYTEATIEPVGVAKEDYICRNGRYYVQAQNRFPYIQDKTVNEHMAILTLMAIAKEIRYYFDSMHKGEPHVETSVRQDIARVQTVHLGVGLPPAHLSALKDAVTKYYNDFFGQGISFTYNGMSYNLKLGKLGIYPQNYAAITAFGTKDKPDSIMGGAYDDYFALDWGGYTLDKIPMVNGKLDFSGLDSLENGIATFFDVIIAQIRKNTGRTIDEKMILNVLNGKRTVLSDEIQTFIKSYAESWTHSVLDKVGQTGVNFYAYPVLFMGGTSILLKPFIESYPEIGVVEFIDTSRVNAKAYKRIIQRQVLNGKSGG